MKKLTVMLFMLSSTLLMAQESVTIKFIRPSKFQGSGAKVRILIKDAEYFIKNGSEISVNVPHDFSGPLAIEAKASGSKTSYSLRPKPDEKYVFEVGFEFKGLYLKRIEGEELAIDQVIKKTDEAEGDTKLQVDREGKAVGFTIEKVDQSEAIRKEWLARGGKIKNESVMLTGTYFGMDLKDLDTRVDGYGGGVSTATNWIKLKIPEYKTGISTWNSFNYGWSMDMLLYQYKLNVNIDPDGSMDMTVLNLSLPIAANLGWTFGIGKFLDPGNWKGVALTLKYRPSVTLNMVSTTSEIKLPAPINTTQTDYSSDTNASFNLGGFGVDFEFSNFTATMNKLAPKPKTKFSFFVLPPVGDTPLFISVSLGISWYSR
ncbi:MAG TPA: hypothetical protein DDY04_03620 [Bacteroidales bacterium]|nr:hypothetical protein [Bacteroidales bacterium]